MKLFVWDLHGTLEQGNENAVVAMSNVILERYGYKERFTDELGRELYGLRWYEYFERLLPREPHARHIELQVASFDFSNSKQGADFVAQYVRPSKNAKLVLGEIAKKHTQIVISNTVPESLPKYLSALQMLEFFPEGTAFAVNQHAREAKRTKTDVLEGYLAKNPYREIVVIGDSEGDMKMADDIGAKAYLYTHAGFTFRSDKGHFKINDLIELTREL